MKQFHIIRNTLLVTAVLLAGMVCTVGIIEACPFCSSVGLTFTDQMAGRDVVVSASLLEIPEVDDDAEELPRAKFEIDEVFRGEELVKPGMQFEALLVGRYPVGEKFFVMGVDPPQMNWTTPLKASDRLLDYLREAWRFARVRTGPFGFLSGLFRGRRIAVGLRCLR